MDDRYQAVVFDEYGDPDVLHTVERDAPDPGPGQVRIAVRAAGVNPFEWKVRSGRMAEAMPLELPSGLGTDVAGTIDRLGEGVDAFAVGDAVFGKATSGGYAELALAAVDRITAKPPTVPWEVAAGLPIPVTAAHHALDQLGLAPGGTLVIDGATGGVGGLAVQVARRRGLTVIGTASEPNHDYLRSLGARPVTYGDGLAGRVRRVAPQGVAGALDASGRGSLPALIELTGSPERVITLADPSADALGVRFLQGEPDAVPAVLADAAAQVVAGTIVLPVARTYPLADAARAHRDSESGHVRGKLVLVTG